jgi:hypothetical protein
MRLFQQALWDLLTKPVSVQVGCRILQEQAKPDPLGWEIFASTGVEQRLGTCLILGKPAQIGFSTCPKWWATHRPESG